MAILLAILSTMSIGVGEFLAGGATKQAKANEVTSAMFAAGVAMTAVVAVVWPGDPSGRDLVLGAIAGTANGVAILLLYLAYSRGSIRSAAPAAAVVMSSVPIAWDVVVSGSNPPVITWLGIAVGVLAIGLSSYEPGGNDETGLGIAIVAGAVFGVLLILLGEISDGSGGSPIFVQRLVGFAVALVATRATGRRFFPADPSVRRTSFGLGLCATAAVVLFVLALQAGGSLSIVSVIGSQYAAVAVLLGVVLRGQQMTRWQALGLAGTSLAVALITLG